MPNEKVVKLLRDAVAAVDEANVPSDLRASALRIAADRLAGDAPTSAGSRIKPTAPKASSSFANTTTEPLDKIAGKLGLDVANVARVFEVDENGVHLLVARRALNSSKLIAMQEVAQLVIGARQALGEEWTPVNDVRLVADDRGVLNTPNWAAAVKELDGAGFRFRGSSHAREVKINQVGYEAAGLLVTRLTSGE